MEALCVLSQRKLDPTGSAFKSSNFLSFWSIIMKKENWCYWGIIYIQNTTPRLSVLSISFNKFANSRNYHATRTELRRWGVGTASKVSTLQVWGPEFSSSAPSKVWAMAPAAPAPARFRPAGLWNTLASQPSRTNKFQKLSTSLRGCISVNGSRLKGVIFVSSVATGKLTMLLEITSYLRPYKIP